MVDTTAEQKNAKMAVLPWIDSLLSWLRSHDGTVLLAGLGFQIVVLLVMIATPFMTLTTGDTILLRVVPVDPRDLFRGDYVILSYEFSRVAPQSITGLQPSDQHGQTVYVTLVPEEDGEHWRASQFSYQKPSTGKFIRGQMKGHNQIEFGIESYFVQEDDGRTYERAAQLQKLSAEVALDRNGNAVLKRLVIN